MSIFDDVVLEWAGKEYTVPEDRVMRLIAKIEDVVTLHEIHQYAERGTAPLGKMSMAYATALNVAGCRVSDAEVYKRVMSSGTEGAAAQEILMGLLQMMVPPEDLQIEEPQGDGARPPGKPTAARK